MLLLSITRYCCHNSLVVFDTFRCLFVLERNRKVRVPSGDDVLYAYSLFYWFIGGFISLLLLLLLLLCAVTNVLIAHSKTRSHIFVVISG